MLMGLQIFDTLHLAEIKAHGFDMVRIDCQHEPNPEPILNEIQAAGLTPLAILREVDQLDATGEGVHVELGNEPDLAHEGWTPAMYRERADAFIERSRGRHHLWFGAVSNLNARGYAFLRGLPWKDWPATVGATIHRYPGTNMGPAWSPNRHPKKILGIEIQNAGKRWTRVEENEEVRRIVGDRPIGHSEGGYNRLEHSEEDQAACMAEERRIFAADGFVFAVGYQINSAPGDPVDIPESYGFRRADGTWRPVTEAWTA